MKNLILTIALVFATQISFSQVDESFKKEVLKVIEKSGADGQMAAAKKQILAMIPEDKHAAFLIEFEAFMPKVHDATAKVYMEEYTKEDIKAMLAFYESPVGKKMAEKSEIIASKSQEAMMSLQGDIQALVMKYMK
jgi:uncharacterized protein